ncbi:MAG: hypothetical protein AB2A00_13925 [Myxococcota bacterium]
MMLLPDRWRVPTTVAFHTLSLVALLVMALRAHGEDLLLRAVYERGTLGASTDEERVLQLREFVHRNVSARLPASLKLPAGPHALLTPRSAGDELTDPRNCASFAFTYARALQLGGHDVKVVAMTVNGVPGKHVTVEVELGGRWVCMDPNHNVAWRREDGQLAGCREVVDNWAYYVRQVPEVYARAIRYQPGGARYTNWDKIPGVMPLVGGVLGALLGEERAATFSVRAYVLNVHRAWFLVFLPVYLVAVGWQLRRRRSPA